MKKRRKSTQIRKMSALALAALMLALAACSGNNTPDNTPAPTAETGSPLPSEAPTSEPTAVPESHAPESHAPETAKPTEEPAGKPSWITDPSEIPKYDFVQKNKNLVYINVSKASSGDHGIGSYSYQLTSMYYENTRIYDALQKLNIEITEQALITYADLIRDRDRDAEVTVSYIQKLYLRRADRGYVSILFETRTGGEHPEYSSVNLKGKAGDRVALSDIVPDLAALASLINERVGFTVTEAYLEDAPVWTLDRDGLYFVFNSGEYEGFNLDAPTAVLVPYASLGVEDELKPRTEDGNMELPLGLPAYCVENGEVKTLSFSAERVGGDWDWYPELGTVYDGKTCTWIFDRGEDPVTLLDGSELNLIYAGGKLYLYVFDSGTGGYRQLVVMELSSEGELEPLDGGARYNDGRIVDPSRIMLGDYTNVLSHIYGGDRAFSIGEDGIPVPAMNYYDVQNIDDRDTDCVKLYALKPFEAVLISDEDGSFAGSITIPTGAELYFNYTTDFFGEEDADEWQAYCILSFIEDETEIREIVIRVDAQTVAGDALFTVNGENIFDLFAGMDFYRSGIIFYKPGAEPGEL
ncbi:MAG: hypothetical protein IKZ82_08100 [Clostridia bacterium]|nr:hypothetical protein [Clostridia bacterium]